MTPASYRVATPVPRALWEELLAGTPEALVSQSPAWLECLCEMGYEDASRLYETPDGRRLVLPMVRRRGWPANRGPLESLPKGWGIGGPLSGERMLVSDAVAILADLAQQSAVITSLRPNPLDGAVWAAARPAGALVVHRLAHVLDLEGGFPQVWEKRFSSNARRHVRQAERASLNVKCDTKGEFLPVFEFLLRRSIDRWADMQHEPRWLAHWRLQPHNLVRRFAYLATRISGAICLWVAWQGERPAAAIIVLRGANAHYTQGVMDKDVAGPTYANFLLHKLAIEEACQLGCRHYHMGESGNSTSLAQFKSHFGARPYHWAEYHFERLPLMRANRLFRTAVKRLIGFKDVPK